MIASLKGFDDATEDVIGGDFRANCLLALEVLKILDDVRFSQKVVSGLPRAIFGVSCGFGGASAVEVDDILLTERSLLI